MLLVQLALAARPRVCLRHCFRPICDIIYIMVNISKFNNNKLITACLAIILLVFLGLSYGMATSAAVDDESVQLRCWLQEQCEVDFGGTWGRITSDRFKSTGATKDDDWSAQNCRPLGPEGKPTARCFTGNPSIPLQIGIPGAPKRFCSVYKLGEQPLECSSDAFCQEKSKGHCRPGIEGGFPGYLSYFYKFFVAALSVFAVTMVTWGGFKRLMAAGGAERIKDANDVIFKAIIGLVLALISYSLLNLINPRLVANTVPLIEKVKPEFFGFCPSYSESQVLYESGYQMYRCQGGSNPNIVCTEDAQCGGGLCSTGDVAYGKPGDTCGGQFVLNGRKCIGLECSGTQGCFPNDYGDNPTYACSNYLFKGKIASGIEINYVDLLPVCNNGNIPINSTATSRDGCAVSAPNGATADEIGIEDNSSYAIQECWADANPSGASPIRQSVCGAVGMKGYALVVEIETGGTVVGGGNDDWFAVDASTCNSLQTKRIHSCTAGEPDNDDPKAAALDQLDFSCVSKDRLFDPDTMFNLDGSIKNPVTCDLSIGSQEFYDR